VLQLHYSNNSVVLLVNYMCIIGELQVDYRRLQDIALVLFVLFGDIGVMGGYCRLYRLWQITSNRIPFSRHIGQRAGNEDSSREAVNGIQGSGKGKQSN